MRQNAKRQRCLGHSAAAKSDQSNPIECDVSRDAVIGQAAVWYAANRGTCPHPVVPALRSRFGLSPIEAVRAFKAANGTKKR